MDDLLQIINNGSIIIVRWSNLNDGKITFITENIFDLIGIDKQEALRSCKIGDRIFPIDKNDFNQSIINTLIIEKKEKVEITHRLIHNDGSIIWVNHIVWRINNNEYISHITDITNFVELKQQNKLLNTAIKQAEVAVVITNLNSEIVYVNPWFTKITEYTFEEVKGKNPRILNAHKLPEEFYKNMWDTISSGKAWQGQFINKKKYGDIYYEKATVTPIFNNDNTIENFVAIKEDVTGVVIAENNCKELFNNSLEGVFQSTLDGRYIRVNKALANIYGYDSPHDLVSNITDIAKQIYLYPEDRERFIDEIKKHNIVEGLEYQIKKTDGSICWVYERARAVLRDGEIKYFEGYVIDITKSKLIEKELVIAKDKAQESDRLKSVFLSNMSHEIRTPLNGIVGFSTLLKKPGITIDKINSYVDIIQNNSTRLLSVINDVLDISKIQTKQLTIYTSQFNVNKLMFKVKKQFTEKALDKKNTLIVNVLENNVYINSDIAKVTQVIVNLLDNALKFTNSGTITVGYELQTNFIYFYVEDTGVGIDPKYYTEIFQPFYQIALDPGILYNGTGLGLSIAKAYVEILGGEIWLESKVGEGTKFYFTIPRHEI